MVQAALASIALIALFLIAASAYLERARGQKHLNIQLHAVAVQFHQRAAGGGFAFAHELGDEALGGGKVQVAQLHRHEAAGVRDVESLERDVRRAAGKFVNERTKRRPMIVPVVMET